MYKNFQISSEKYGIFNNFSKINLIFGAGSCGKTTFLNYLQEIFSGKDKNSKINSENITKNEYNIINIDSQFQINELTKLTSKNLNKIKLQNIINDSNNSNLKEELIIFLNNYQAKLDETINKDSILKRQIKDQNIDELILNLIEGNVIASRSEENILYIKEKTCLETLKNILLIDDFDAFLNEDKINKLFNLLENLNVICFLTTNKPESLFYSFNKYANFKYKNLKLIQLDDLITFQNDETNIIDYLSDSFFLESSISNYSKTQFLNSLGRLLVNDNVNLVFKNRYLPNYVNIHCSNEIEYNLLFKIKEKLENY